MKIYSRTIDPSEWFGELETIAYNRQYDLTVDSNFNITLTCISGDDLFPTITVETKHVTESGKAVYYYSPSAQYPTLSQKDLLFIDSFEYYTKIWHSISPLLTAICKFRFCPDECIGVNRS